MQSTRFAPILAALFLLGVPATADTSSDPISLESSDEENRKAKAVHDALQVCKTDATAAKNAFAKVAGKKNGAQMRSVVGGLMGRWTTDVIKLKKAHDTWGKKPEARSAVGQLVGKVTQLRNAINALPKDKEVSKEKMADLKRQEQAARTQQDEVSGVLEPVLYR